MAVRRKRPAPVDSNPSSPSQEDESDIVEEVGAERDEESGELVADEENVRDIGAVDAESVRENRRLEEMVGKKRGNVKGVVFNVNDVIVKYDTMIRAWAPNTIDISVKRLAGSPIQHIITTRPSTGVELYAALMEIHGQHVEAPYEVKFFDNNSKVFRGTGKITLPNTMRAQQGQQPMLYPPPGYPPGYPPPGYPPPPPGYPAPQAQAPQQAQPPAQQQPQAPQPVVVHAPVAPNFGDMILQIQQVFGAFQEMQRQFSPPPQTPIAMPPPQMQMPPPPPPGADPVTMMTWMNQAMQLFQQMQTATQPPAPAPQAAPPAQSTPAQAGPTAAPPPGMMWGWYPGFGFVLVPATGGMPGSPSPMHRGPHRPPPFVGQQGMDDGAPERRGFEPPPRPQSTTDQVRRSMSEIRSVMSLADELRSTFQPQGGGVSQMYDADAATTEEEDSPVQVVEAGPAKIVFDKNDGSLRKWETGLANIGPFVKWIGDQADKIERSKAAQQQRQTSEARPQLPPNYIEMREGEEPPPGFRAERVDPSRVPRVHTRQPAQDLPPAPEDLPPPIQEPSRQMWSIPSIPEGES